MSDQERLEAFERMLADVQKNYQEFSTRMEKLKAEKRRNPPPSASIGAIK